MTMVDHHTASESFMKHMKDEVSLSLLLGRLSNNKSATHGVTQKVMVLNRV